jgi:hypothetical protein
MGDISIPLFHQIPNLKNGNITFLSKGFLFKYNGTCYLISVHHFLPILKTYVKNADNKLEDLRHTTEINWNELNIFDTTNLKLNNKIIKNYKIIFEETTKNIKIFIENKEEKYPILDYCLLGINEIIKVNMIYFRFYIGNITKKSDLENVNKFKGMSGAPIFSNDNNLLGVFTKYIIVNNHIYGLVLPTIYIIKSLSRKNNNVCFTMSYNNDDNLKIGNYEINKKEKTIYYHVLKNHIPLDVYYNFEGDDDKQIQLTKIDSKEEFFGGFIINEKFNFTKKIHKADTNKYLLNSGLIALLKNQNYEKTLEKIRDTYLNYEGNLNNVFIELNDS